MIITLPFYYNNRIGDDIAPYTQQQYGDFGGYYSSDKGEYILPYIFTPDNAVNSAYSIDNTFYKSKTTTFTTHLIIPKYAKLEGVRMRFNVRSYVDPFCTIRASLYAYFHNATTGFASDTKIIAIPVTSVNQEVVIQEPWLYLTIAELKHPDLQFTFWVEGH